MLGGSQQSCVRRQKKGCVAMGDASEFGKDNDLVHKVVVTGRKVGWGREEWTKLAENEDLIHSFWLVINGHARIDVVDYIVDCSRPPEQVDVFTPLPESEQIASRYTGQIRLTPQTMGTYIDPHQKKGKLVGSERYQTYEGQPVLTAHVLDHCLRHPALIPEAWKNKSVYFWGTIYRGGNYGHYVRCLYWCDGPTWQYSDIDVEGEVITHYPAAVFAG